MAANPSILSLPDELLLNTLFTGFSSEFDLPYLWCTVRNTCQRLRYLVDELVARRHFRKSFITYTLPNPDIEAREENPRVKFWLSFDSFAKENPRIAIFRPDTFINANPIDETWLSLFLQKLIRSQDEGSLYPAHMLSCYRYVNDTELCGFDLRINDPTQGLWEIRIDWKATLSELLVEEHLRQTLSRAFVKQQRSNRVELDEKEIYGAPRAMRLHLLSHRRSRDESFQHARQKRIAAHYASKGLDLNSILQADRQKMLLIRQKAEEIEDHQSSMNQFSFE